MASILDEFMIFKDFPGEIKQQIKLFNVIEFDIVICVTNEDKVHGFGNKSLIERFTGYREDFIDNNIILISELCNQNVQQIFRFNNNNLFAKNIKGQIFRSGFFARSKFEGNKYHKPMRIEFFDDKKIIDISCGYRHCLALSSEGLVYGWGDNSDNQFDETKNWAEFLSPVLLNYNESELGIKKRVKHIHCCKHTSVLVSFDGFIFILNPDKWHEKNRINNLKNVYKIFLNLNNESSMSYIVVKKQWLY